MKKYFLPSVIICALVVFIGSGIYTTPEQEQQSITCFFSPTGGCTKAITNELNSAQSEVLIQMFQFSYPVITSAIVDAHKRGVKVTVILDKYQLYDKASDLKVIVKAGIKTYIDKKHTSAHNKVAIIDDKVLITGSFNYTYNAEVKNAENIVIIKNNQDIITAFTNNFLIHKGHSDLYK